MLNNLLLRWSIGLQDTVALKNASPQAFESILWLSKLSILSFQKWFPGSSCVLLYNGNNFSGFKKMFDDIGPIVSIEILNQKDTNELRFINPYSFSASGVWWKWIPFRLDKSKCEIAIDTDIICIDKPSSWYEWIESDSDILLAPERYKNVVKNTCGDLYKHPILKDKSPINCGIVGQRAYFDSGDRFFEIANSIRIGENRDSLFIDEQGAINVWARSLESDGRKITILDFNKNVWVRDFIYFLRNGFKVETLHAVTWHKKIVLELKDIFLDLINDKISLELLLTKIFEASKKLSLESRQVLLRQFGSKDSFSKEILFL